MIDLYLDIETIPAQRPDVLAEIRASKEAELASAIASVKAPGNYKKAETIAEWDLNERPRIIEALKTEYAMAIDETYRKTGLDGAYGQICVIGFTVDDQTPVALVAADLGIEGERRLLSAFGDFMSSHFKPSEIFETCVIGHNVASFDLRFLAQRHIINGLRPHAIIARSAQAKPWEQDKVYDTMVQWGGVGKSVSLDKLCKALGVATSKGDLDGSKVWDYVQAGRIAEVSAYCVRDVEATRSVHRRMTFREPAPIIVPAAYGEVPLAAGGYTLELPLPLAQTQPEASQATEIDVAPAPAAELPVEQRKSGRTLRLGQIEKELNFPMSADLLRKLGIEPVGKDRSAVLYAEEDLPKICDAVCDLFSRRRAEIRHHA